MTATLQRSAPFWIVQLSTRALRSPPVRLAAVLPGRPCRQCARRLLHSERKFSSVVKPAARVETPRPNGRHHSNPSSARPSVSITAEGLKILWPDQQVSTFDFQWLLDHCRCRRCFHPTTRQRLKPLADLSEHSEPSLVDCDRTGVTVNWAAPDTHQTRFPFGFLRRAAYDPPLGVQSAPQQECLTLWNALISDAPPSVDQSSLLPSEVGEERAEKGVLRWLDKVHEFGFCFVSGVPTTPEATESLIRRISHIRETHYGGFWDFTSNMSHGDLAYSTERLPAHTDTTYFTDPAGLQIFHLLSHPMPPGAGGATLLVDAFQTAAIMATVDPAAYSSLSQLRIPHHASGTPGTLLRPVVSQPILRHDEGGKLVQVRWNNEDRGILGGHGWTADGIKAWYRSARQFEKMIQSTDAEYWVQMRPGTVLVIDNWRVMHGRSSFTGERRMCGAYIGADDWRSRRAALAKRFVRPTQSPEEDDIWTFGW